MNTLDNTDETLAPLRDLPLEVDLEQVAHMVAAFPPTVGTMAWLASLKTNLNTILMMTIGTILIGTAIHFMAAGKPVAQTTPEAQVPQISIPAPVSEAPQAETAQPAAAPALHVADTARALAATEPVTQEPVTALAPVRLAANVATPLAPPAPLTPTPLPTATLTQAGTTEKTYDMHDFDGVASFCDADISVEEGPWSVTASGDPDRLEGLEVKVENGVLKITTKKNKTVSLTNQGTIRVEVHLPSLTRLDEGGSGHIRVGKLDGTAQKDFSVNVLGSGEVDLENVQVLGELALLVQGSGNINCRSAYVLTRTRVTVLGSGSVKASGNTQFLIEVLIQGSGDVDVSGLKAEDGNVTILGSGNASVNCTGKLQRLVQGSGTINNAATSAGGTEDSNGK